MDKPGGSDDCGHSEHGQKRKSPECEGHAQGDKPGEGHGHGTSTAKATSMVTSTVLSVRDTPMEIWANPIRVATKKKKEPIRTV